MFNYKRVAVAAVATVGVMVAASVGEAAKPAGNCFVKAAQGTNSTLAGAKVQAYEALLQATDWGLWGNWMSSSASPDNAYKGGGYSIDKPKWKCGPGGIGTSCIAQARICKG